jgi:hypothetical protein
MSEVDVEEVTCTGHHEVVVVSVTQSKHIRGHTVGGGGDHEVLHPTKGRR